MMNFYRKLKRTAVQSFIVSAVCAGTTMPMHTLAQSQRNYCSPIVVSLNNLWIANFQTGGGVQNIDYINPTQYSSLQATVRPGKRGYQDLTNSHKLSANPGQLVDFMIKPGGQLGLKYGASIWVDWNNDGVFAAQERVFTSGGWYSADNVVPEYSRFQIPFGQKIGNYRMRIVQNGSQTSPNDPCSGIYSGEFIDFSLAVTNETATPTPPVNPVPPVTPSATDVVKLTKNSQSTNSISFSWVGSSLSPSYDVYYSTSNVAPTATTVLNTSNSTKSTATTATINGLSNFNTYYVWVRTPFSANKVWAGPIIKDDSYCKPSSQSRDRSWISSFVTTGAYKNISYSAPVATTGTYGYQNLVGSNQIVALPGSNIQFSLSTGGYAGYPGRSGISAWIDWNSDGNFSTAERVYTSDGFVSTVPVAGKANTFFKIPSNQKLGTYRLRLVTDGNIESPTDACRTVYYGEYADFSVVVVNEESIGDPLLVKNTSNFAISSQTNTSASLTWTDDNATPTNNYEIYYSTINAVPTNTTVLDASNYKTSKVTSATFSSLSPAQTYYFWVRQANSKNLKWVGPVTKADAFCTPGAGNTSRSWISSFVTNTPSSSNATTSNISYSAPSGTPSAIGYQNLTNGTNKITAVVGTDVPFSLKVSGMTAGVAVWIDWNSNGVFDATERVYNSTNYTSIVNAIFKTTNTSGKYRMRVVADWSLRAPSDPCRYLSQGEYIDFSFEVLPNVATATATDGTKTTTTTDGNTTTTVITGPTGNKTTIVSAPITSSAPQKKDGVTATIIYASTPTNKPNFWKLAVYQPIQTLLKFGQILLQT